MDNLIEFKEGESNFSKPGEGEMGEVWEHKSCARTWEPSYGAENIFAKKILGRNLPGLGFPIITLWDGAL